MYAVTEIFTQQLVAATSHPQEQKKLRKSGAKIGSLKDGHPPIYVNIILQPMVIFMLRDGFHQLLSNSKAINVTLPRHLNQHK